MKELLIMLVLATSTLSHPVGDETTPKDGEKCGYESCTSAQSDVLNIHIVPHTHDDVGWLKTVDQYYYGSKNEIQRAGVQYILDSVVKELWEDPKRRFIYVETAFFWKWWVRQPDHIQHKVHTLVRQGRLQFVGGAWSMNDEAATHYQSTIDQFTWGLSKLNDTFGKCGRPHVGWQIDPFGHSREFAALLAQSGFDALLLGRIDYQDKSARLKSGRAEYLWRGQDQDANSDIFSGVMYNTYSPPPGFCFDVLCTDEPIIDDVDSPMYNVEQRISQFLNFVYYQSLNYTTNNIILTMGGDFTYQDAGMWYTNLDKLIEYTNLRAAQEGLRIKMFYSTPNCYVKAIRDSKPTLPIKQDDFFPYASDPHAFWTGYFTSRPTVKYFERQGNNYLQTVKQLQVVAGLEEHNQFVLNELKSAMGVMQHHDAITGTEKQHVTHDYERILDHAIEDSLIIARQAFNKIAQHNATALPLFSYDRCKLNESSCHISETSENFVVTLYNPLGIKLNTPVRVPVQDGVYSVVAPNGDEISSQLVEIPDFVLNIRQSNATHELLFIAKNVKPLGTKSFYVRKSKKIAKRDTKKNTNQYYSDVNDYWKHVRDETELYVKNLEDIDEVDKPVKVEKIPDAPVISVTNDKSFINTHTETDPILRVLKDGDEDTSYIKELERLIEEAKWAEVAKKVEKRYPVFRDEEMRMLSDQPMVVERYPEDHFLENENIKLRISNTTGDITHITTNNIESPFEIMMYYYPGFIGNNAEYNNRSSGAYIFRPDAKTPNKIDTRTTNIVKGEIVEELHYTSEFASGTVRVYKDFDYLEHDWVVGPINIDDNVSKEVIVRYSMVLNNNGEFYTDSNGRQMLKRRINERPQFNLTVTEPIAGNYYPVTNKIYIEDNEKRFTVLTDRAEGGTSLNDGVIELMVHRRLLHDDAFGVGEALNEVNNGKGLIARGKHRVLISLLEDKDKLQEDKVQVLKMHLEPQVFVSDAGDVDLEHWLTLNNCFGGLKESLPVGVHLLTLEPLRGKQILLRFENYMDVNNTVVDLDIFSSIKVKSLKETALSADRWLEEVEKWKWYVEEDFYDDFNDSYGDPSYNKKGKGDEAVLSDDGLKISLKAGQIRSFVADVDFVDDLGV